jgi:hypothetical protein
MRPNSARTHTTQELQGYMCSAQGIRHFSAMHTQNNVFLGFFFKINKFKARNNKNNYKRQSIINSIFFNNTRKHIYKIGIFFYFCVRN